MSHGQHTSNPERYKGQKFGKWTVLGWSRFPGAPLFLTCECECGRVQSNQLFNIITKKSTQCQPCSLKAIHEKNMSRMIAAGKDVRSENGRTVLVCKCGRAISPKVKSGKCHTCFWASQIGIPKVPWKYPENSSLIAQRYGVTRQYVSLLCIKLGWDGMLQRLQQRADKTYVRKNVRGYRAGIQSHRPESVAAKIAEICSSLNVSTTTLRNRTRELGSIEAAIADLKQGLRKRGRPRNPVPVETPFPYASN